MKKLIALVLVAFATTAFAKAEVKTVCHEDSKTKKEVCKKVKTHKKVEGTKVPEKAPPKSKLAQKK